MSNTLENDVDEDDYAMKLWQEELKNTTDAKNLDNNSNGHKLQEGVNDKKLSTTAKLSDPKGEIQDGDKFLMEFMTHRKWLEGSSDASRSRKLGGGTNNDNNNEGERDDDSLDELDKMDEFESKYNFRFEEANSNNNHTNNEFAASGATHSIVQYARSNEGRGDNTIRRIDDSRKLKRQKRKERKLAERKMKEERLKRLKNAKRLELESRLEKVRSVLGYTTNATDNHNDYDDNMDVYGDDIDDVVQGIDGIEEGGIVEG